MIIKNLLANGCAYGIENGVVEMSAFVVETALILHVKNQGKGPKVEFKSQVFTRFAEGPEGAHGLGLGLSIIRELCERLGGSIEYVMEDETVIFTIVLPLHTTLPDSKACGSNEFLFESFDDAIEL